AMITFKKLNIIVIEIVGSSLNIRINALNRYKINDTQIPLHVVCHNSKTDQYSIITCMYNREASFVMENRKIFSDIYVSEENTVDDLVLQYKSRKFMVNQFEYVVSVLVEQRNPKSSFLIPVRQNVHISAISEKLQKRIRTFGYERIDKVKYTFLPHVLEVLDNDVNFVLVNKGFVTTLTTSDHLSVTVKIPVDEIDLTKYKVFQNEISERVIDKIILKNPTTKNNVDKILVNYIHEYELYEIYKLELTRKISTERDPDFRVRMSIDADQRRILVSSLSDAGEITEKDFVQLSDTNTNGPLPEVIQYDFERKLARNITERIAAVDLKGLKQVIRKASKPFVTIKSLPKVSRLDVSNVHKLCTPITNVSQCSTLSDYCAFDGGICRVRISKKQFTQFVNRVSHELLFNDRIRFNILNDYHESIRDPTFITKTEDEYLIRGAQHDILVR
ncbi:hypothetical protein KAU11_07125, partial [Candidatus Babeliales bacterium]|nr:hypothetical protein [Candidatus Babeliales bacterium]